MCSIAFVVSRLLAVMQCCHYLCASIVSGQLQVHASRSDRTLQVCTLRYDARHVQINVTGALACNAVKQADPRNA
jgi:hypothetical protein